MKPIGIILILFTTTVFADTNQRRHTYHQALKTLDKAVSYFYSINTRGGYVYYVTPDLKQRWGESPADEYTIEVQPPGTPAVGLSFLRVYNLTGNPLALQAATDAAYALIRGQNDLGGWEHTIRFNQPRGNRVSFDDDQTQTAIRFLMALDQHVDDDSLKPAIENTLILMMTSQLKNGGWPHRVPEQGNYHDYATYNDEGINDCIQVMIDAYTYYKKEEYKISVERAGRFIMMSQLPPPQPGWAQQYNEYLQPAWARSFEPPSVCSTVTLNNINTLVDLYLFTNQRGYLDPVPDAVRWLEETRLPNGKWARFAELGTNQPLYYDRGRIRVNSIDELHIERRTGYGYQVDLGDRLQIAKTRFEHVREQGAGVYLKKQNESLDNDKILDRLTEREPQVRHIIETLDDQGRWISKKDRYKKRIPGQRWNGEYEVQDRISSAVFNRNVSMLCEYIEMVQQLDR